MRQVINSRREKFRNQIRRTHLKKIYAQKRLQYEENELSLKELAAEFHLYMPIQHQITFYDFLTIKRKQLLTPFQFISEQEESENTQKISLDSHINFWKLYSSNLFYQTERATSQLGLFMIEFIQSNSFESIHYHTYFQKQFLSTLEYACSILIEQQKKIVLNWVAETSGLDVIRACLTPKYYSYSQYSKMYHIIQSGIKSQLKSQNFQASEILIQILKNADWDDTYELFENCFGIVIYLNTKICKYCKIEQIKILNKALLYMIDIYDQSLVHYAKNGVGYVACQLITSQFEGNILDGLKILKVLTEVSQGQIINFFLNDKEIQSTGIWSIFCSTVFSLHPSIAIRKYYFSCLQNILVNGGKNDAIRLCHLFAIHKMFLLTLFNDTLINQDQSQIVCFILKSLSSLLTYGRQLSLNQENNVIYEFEKMQLKQKISVFIQRDNKALVFDAQQLLLKIEQYKQYDEECV